MKDLFHGIGKIIVGVSILFALLTIVRFSIDLLTQNEIDTVTVIVGK